MEETGGLRRRLRRYWAMRKDPDESAMLTASLSFFVNAAIGVGKLLLGIGLGSFWFVVNGAYYLLLCIARGRAVGQYRRALAMDDGGRQALERAVTRHTGVFLILLGLVYALTCLRMYLHGDSTVYRGYMVYLVALVAFVKMGFAISGTLSARKRNSPIVTAVKVLSFAAALVSIVVTQCTLLTFKNSPHAVTSSALFGLGVSGLFLLAGLIMAIRGRKSAGK